jgi:hypothetical protein
MLLSVSVSMLLLDQAYGRSVFLLVQKRLKYSRGTGDELLLVDICDAAASHASRINDAVLRSYGTRAWSIAQEQDGGAVCTADLGQSP